MKAWTAFAQAARPDTPAVVELNLWLQDWAKRLDFRLMDVRRCLAPHLVLALGNRGVLGMQVAGEQGGLLGFSTFELLRVQRQLGAIDLTLAFFVGLNNGLGIRPIQRFGSATAKARYLPQLATGRMLAAFALTEQGAGSNPLNMAATARRQGEHWRLDGRKSWCGSAAWAGVISVFARHLDEQGRDCGFIGFCLDAEQPGLRQGSEALTLGLKGMVQNQVHFDAVEARAEQVLGSPFAGMAVASDTMVFGRLGIAATCVGALWRCVQLMTRYSTRRSLGTQRLWDHEHTQTLIGGAVCAATALGGWVDDLATGLDQGLPTPPAEVLAAVKWLASELLGEVSDSALQMLGARGYCDNNPIGQLWRDARITRLFEGPSQTLAAFIGQRVLEQPAVIRTYLASLPHGQLALQRLETWISSERLPPRGSERLSGQVLQLGQCVAWLMLSAQALEEHCRPWVMSRLAAAERDWEHLVSPGFSLAGLGDWVDARIGAFDRPRADEEVALDELLVCGDGA
ncbi:MULTISPECIES: acyl-CoA dehydrogenase family protein [Pseudomonas]|uniref:Acyl-CoA dehydrogenase family protein n=1 Tax=Pseudomonas gingeri TaxID=117681 RepID=A0A7Y7WE58_9PSED|nr:MULTISPECIES: acyl-CoA dehydrogenase family protein [Pseudomonas]MCU1740567.1 acyl-CoA dehydrogenase family protein [Pseudomonas sp. 20S_6.2_Bac1]NWB47686.1 acyl-CoA dehydrogenase family protein [Pseudomonas gingeri]